MSTKDISLPLTSEFFLELEVNNYSEQTLYNYKRDLSSFKDFLDKKDIPFGKVSKMNITEYKADLSSQDLSGSTINRMLSCLRTYFKFLVEMDEEAPVSPSSIKLTKTKKKKPRVPELRKVIELIEFPSEFEDDDKVALRNRAMLEVLFSTGLRISELINLDKENIDDSGRIFVLGKGKKERFVYLTPRAFYIVKNYLKTRDDDCPALFIPYSGPNVNKKDKRISTNYLQMKIKKYRELLNINVPISAHTIRHAFATYLAEEGANPAAIQTMLGHESLNTTTRYVNTSERYAEKTHTDFHPLKKDDEED
jgi:site-specific recombinase XerD